jgi:hypothetical protein
VEGFLLGEADGDLEGLEDGDFDGAAGLFDKALGLTEGLLLGAVGDLEGLDDGDFDSDLEGLDDGEALVLMEVETRGDVLGLDAAGVVILFGDLDGLLLGDLDGTDFDVVRSLHSPALVQASPQ